MMRNGVFLRSNSDHKVADFVEVTPQVVSFVEFDEFIRRLFRSRFGTV